MIKAHGVVKCSTKNSTPEGCSGVYTEEVAYRILNLLHIVEGKKASCNFKATIKIMPSEYDCNELEITVTKE